MTKESGHIHEVGVALHERRSFRRWQELAQQKEHPAEEEEEGEDRQEEQLLPSGYGRLPLLSTQPWQRPSVLHHCACAWLEVALLARVGGT